MNANELADELITFVEVYKINNLDCMTLSDAINMLRQQQAEIEALKAKTLTDEEIKETIKPIIYNQYMTAYKYGFEVARAILRKAQEK